MTHSTGLVRRLLVVGVLGLFALGAGCSQHQADWALTDLTGHLPDLQFNLQSADNPKLTAKDFRGKITLVFFGYAHCPDVCPVTMARLGKALQALGDSAQRVRILFISVDPKRDTPRILRSYAQAFSPEAVGATGTPAEIEDLARRYRVAYQATAPDADGNYEVMHSKAVYVFDGRGRVRLLIADTDPVTAIDHDLKMLLAEANS